MHKVMLQRKRIHSFQLLLCLCPYSHWISNGKDIFMKAKFLFLFNSSQWWYINWSNNLCCGIKAIYSSASCNVTNRWLWLAGDIIVQARKLFRNEPYIYSNIFSIKRWWWKEIVKIDSKYNSYQSCLSRCS